MEDLIKLLTFLFNKYELFAKEWESNNKNFYRGNIKVYKIKENLEILNSIYSYREFIEKSETFQQELKELDLKTARATRRVKDAKSIQKKLDRYMKKEHEFGHIEVRKCLNDILGFRIIFDEDYDFDYLKKVITEKFNNIRVVPSNHYGYKAAHAYFISKNNKRFLWELQMWNKSDEEGNLISHHKYKQDYVVWEDKEGE